MNGNDQKAESSTMHQDYIKSEPPESDDSDNDGEIYKNLTEDQLFRAKEYNECFICQKRCASFSGFRRHVFQHASASKFKCEKCFKEFAHLKYLKAHLTIHNENRIFTCDICSQNFATKSSIRGHMRVHTGQLLPKKYSLWTLQLEFLLFYRWKALQMQYLWPLFQRIFVPTQTHIDPFTKGQQTNTNVSVWNLWKNYQRYGLLQTTHGNSYWW